MRSAPAYRVMRAKKKTLGMAKSHQPICINQVHCRVSVRVRAVSVRRRVNSRMLIAGCSHW